MLTIWMVFLLLIGIFLTLFIPPLQKPDEHIHLQKAVSLSNGLFFCNNEKSQAQIQKKYFKLNEIIDKYGITQNYRGKFYYKEYFQTLFAPKELSEKISVQAGMLCTFPSLAYTVQTTGLVVANILNLNSIYSFYLGRLLPVIAYFIILFFLITRSNRAAQLTLLTYSSIPMLLHQLGSYSYDSMQIIVGLFFIFYLFKLIQLKTVSLRQFYIFALILLLLHFIKPGSYWMLFLTPLFFIDKIKIVNNWKKTFAPIFLFYVIIAFLFILLYIPKSEVGESQKITPAIIQSNLFFKEPFQNLSILMYETIEKEFSFYFGSFFGNFGWLDHQLGLSVQIIFFGLIIYIGSKIKIENKFNYPVLKGILAFFIIFGSFALVMLGMYLGHTAIFSEIGGLISYGGQGRYFLLLTPIVLLFFALINQSRNLKLFVFLCTLIFLSFKTGENVFYRYFDYQSLYDIPEISSPLKVDPNFKYDPIFLDRTIKLNLQIDKNKKLKGVTLGYTPQHRGVWLPYIYTVRDGKCEASSKLLINDYAQKKDFFGNQLNIIFPRPLDEKGLTQNTICFEIAPYVLDAETQKQFFLLEFVDKIEIAPIYLR